MTKKKAWNVSREKEAEKKELGMANSSESSISKRIAEWLEWMSSNLNIG